MGKHRIYMLPTRYGLVFAGLVFVILLASINYGNGMGYGLSFLLAAIGFMSMIYTHRNLLNVTVTAARAEPVFCGQPALFRIHIGANDNNTKTGIELIHNKQHLQSFDLEHGESSTTYISCLTSKRGYTPAPRFRLLTRFPFAIVFTWSRDIVLDSRCLVYPRPAEQPYLQNISGIDVDSITNPTRSGEEFAGLREYAFGDSARQIHWRATARSNKLVSKEYSATSGSVIWLDWDHTGGETEHRLSQLCRGVLDAQSAGHHYGLRLPGSEILPASGSKHQHKCLRALACFGHS